MILKVLSFFSILYFLCGEASASTLVDRFEQRIDLIQAVGPIPVLVDGLIANAKKNKKTLQQSIEGRRVLSAAEKYERFKKLREAFTECLGEDPLNPEVDSRGAQIAQRVLISSLSAKMEACQSKIKSLGDLTRNVNKIVGSSLRDTKLKLRQRLARRTIDHVTRAYVRINHQVSDGRKGSAADYLCPDCTLRQKQVINSKALQERDTMREQGVLSRTLKQARRTLLEDYRAVHGTMYTLGDRGQPFRKNLSHVHTGSLVGVKGRWEEVKGDFERKKETFYRNPVYRLLRNAGDTEVRFGEVALVGLPNGRFGLGNPSYPLVGNYSQGVYRPLFKDFNPENIREALDKGNQGMASFMTKIYAEMNPDQDISKNRDHVEEVDTHLETLIAANPLAAGQELMENLSPESVWIYCEAIREIASNQVTAEVLEWTSRTAGMIALGLMPFTFGTSGVAGTVLLGADLALFAVSAGSDISSYQMSYGEDYFRGTCYIEENAQACEQAETIGERLSALKWTALGASVVGVFGVYRVAKGVRRLRPKAMSQFVEQAQEIEQHQKAIKSLDLSPEEETQMLGLLLHSLPEEASAVNQLKQLLVSLEKVPASRREAMKRDILELIRQTKTTCKT